MSSFFNQAKIINVYYNKGDRKPYNINGKPIAYIGEESIGANEATTIRFYLGEDLDSSTAIIVAKRANGDTRLDICEKFGTGVDSYYELTLNAWYAEFKGKMTIVFKVYNGTVTFDSSEMPTEIVSTTGRIVVSDIFNLDVAYAPDASTLVPPFETEEYEDWFFALSTKLDKSSSITVTGALPTLTGGVYDDRYFYVENEGVGKLFYIDGSTAIEVVWGVGTIQLTPSGNGDVVTGLEAGKLYWSEDKGTIVGGLYDDQVVGIGDGFFWFVKAKVGEANIAKGDVVQFAGNVGGQIVVKKAVFAEITTQPDLLMGVAKHNIIAGNKGYIVAIGRLDNINTSGDNFSITQPILYLSTTTPGQLTSTKPTNGFKGSIAAIGRASTGGGSNGFLLVRPNFIKGINEATDVLITSLTNKDILRWDSTSGRWENNADLTDLETNLQDYKDDINDGTIIVGKAENDKDGLEFDATYLKKTTASSTYLTQANASSTYLTQANATAIYIPLSQKSIPNGVATLGVDGRVLPSQLPGSIGEVLEYPTLLDFPEEGAAEKIFIAVDTNKTYRWSGTQYVEISQSLALGETTETAFAGSRGVALETLTDNIVDGTQGLTDTRITNSATTIQPLIVNGIADTSTNLQEWQLNGSVVASLTGGGDFRTSFLSAISGNNNGRISFTSTGALISRNIADANNALRVNLANSSSTGNIANFQFAGANKLEVTKDGFLNQNGTRLFHQTGATSNTFFGTTSGNLTLTGTNNNGYGLNSLVNLTSGSSNTAVGSNALLNTTTGSNNVGFGIAAGRSITTGGTNTFVGRNAGFNDLQLATATNSTAIGNEAYTDASNQMVFGNASVTQFKFDRNSNSESFFSNVNVGVNATGRYIDVMNGTADLQRLRLTTSGTNAVIIATRSSGAVPNMLFQIQATEAMRISAGSLVGINEASPSAQLQVKSNATDRVGLIVDTLASHTANIQEWKVNGSIISRIASGGSFISNSTIFATSGLANGSSGNNSIFVPGATGALITRNIADANPALTVNQINAGSTGDILRLQKAGSSLGVFTHEGRLGIGTTTPGQLLDVNGASRFRNTFFFGATDNIGVISWSDSSPARFILRGQSGYGLSLGTSGVNDRLFINTSGDVGIGNTSPSNILQVKKDQTSDTAVVVSNAGTTGATTTLSFVLQESDTPQGWFRRYRDGTGRTEIGYSDILTFSGAVTGTKVEHMRIASGGEVYIAGTTDQGAYNLQVNGTGVWGAGAYVDGSDIRIKKEVKGLQDGLSVIEKLKPVTYLYEEKYSKDPNRQVGFIAQDLMEVLKEKDYMKGIVRQGKQIYSVAYQEIIPLLTKAVQELSAELKAIKSKLNMPDRPVEHVEYVPPVAEPLVETNNQVIQTNNATTQPMSQVVQENFEPITNFEYDENE